MMLPRALTSFRRNPIVGIGVLVSCMPFSRALFSTLISFSEVLEPLMAILDDNDTQGALSSLSWNPEDVTSWLPSATGRNEAARLLHSTDASLIDGIGTRLDNSDAFSASEWGWEFDWSLLANAPPGLGMDLFDDNLAFSTADAFSHSHSSGVNNNIGTSTSLDLDGPSLQDSPLPQRKVNDKRTRYLGR